MLRSIYFYTKFVFSLIGLSFKYIKSNEIEKKSGKKACDEYSQRVIKNFFTKTIKDTGCKIIVEGVENVPKDEPTLFVSNHEGNFDILVIHSILPKEVSFIAKIEMLKVPFLSHWMKKINCLFMDRSDMKQSLKIILKGIEMIKDGYSLVVFPEGTRSKGREMAEFKSGSFKLATRSKCPIVPITIKNTYSVWEKNNYKIVPNTIYVYIHPTILTDNLTKEEEINLPKKVEDIVKSKL